MQIRIIVRGAILAGLAGSLAGCGGIGSGDSGLFGRREPTVYTGTNTQAEPLRNSMTRGT